MNIKCIVAIFLLTGTCLVSAQQDRLTRLQIRSQFNKKDFIFDLGNAKPITGSGGGTIRQLTVVDMPALQGEGVAFTLFDLDPCSINLPHSHPRATELLFVINGKNLQVGFVEENGGRGAIVNVLKSGQVAVFPRGLIHFEQNLGCQPVRFISQLNNEDPGVVTISNRGFDLPDLALENTYVLSRGEIKSIRSRLPIPLAKGAEECYRKCNIKKGNDNTGYT